MGGGTQQNVLLAEKSTEKSLLVEEGPAPPSVGRLVDIQENITVSVYFLSYC